MVVKWGKTINKTSNIFINDLIVSPCILYVCRGRGKYILKWHSTCVTEEYYSILRVIKAYTAFNKTVGYSVFKIPALILKFGLIDWMLDVIRATNMKTRKKLTIIHQLHINTYVESLYQKCKQSDRDFSSIQNAYECRIIFVQQHL